MKKLLAISVLGGASVAAFGMEDESLAFRLGVGFPIASATRDTYNQVAAFGFSYNLSAPTYGKDARPGSAITLDYVGRGDFRSIPINYNFVWKDQNSDISFSAGAGLTFLGFKDGTNDESVARFSYRFAASLDLSKGVNASFVELAFNGVSKSDFNTIGLYLGVRF